LFQAEGVGGAAQSDASPALISTSITAAVSPFLYPHCGAVANPFPAANHREILIDDLTGEEIGVALKALVVRGREEAPEE
jgi:hypothetical protein